MSGLVPILTLYSEERKYIFINPYEYKSLHGPIINHDVRLEQVSQVRKIRDFIIEHDLDTKCNS